MKLVQGQMDEAARAALASGRAEPALRLFVDTLFEMNGVAFESGDAISGVALEQEAPAPMSTHALDMAFAAIEKGGQKDGYGKKERKLRYAELESMPAMLKDAILDAEAKRGWGFVAFGISSLNLDLGGIAK